MREAVEMPVEMPWICPWSAGERVRWRSLVFIIIIVSLEGPAREAAQAKWWGSLGGRCSPPQIQDRERDRRYKI